MNQKLFFLLVISILICNSKLVQGQEAPQTIVLSKGEILDVLLLHQRPDTRDALQSYFQVAFPVAKKMSYVPLPGFKVVSNVNGNLMPEGLILGKWTDRSTREAFLDSILTSVPDFHERRREIWSYFGLTYYELTEDVSFSIDRTKVHFASAFWLKDGKKNRQIQTKVRELANRSGGNTLVILREGSSPSGYMYNPTLFILTEWDSVEEFEQFQSELGSMWKEDLLHVNELGLQ